MIPDKTLEEIEDRASKATPGPWMDSLTESIENWFKLRDENMNEIASGVTWSNHNGPLAKQQSDDFTFLRYARTDIPLLLNEIKRLKAAVGEAFNSFNDIIESGVVDCPECNRHEEIAQEWLKTYGEDKVTK